MPDGGAYHPNFNFVKYRPPNALIIGSPERFNRSTVETDNAAVGSYNPKLGFVREASPSYSMGLNNDHFGRPLGKTTVGPGPGSYKD